MRQIAFFTLIATALLANDRANGQTDSVVPGDTKATIQIDMTAFRESRFGQRLISAKRMLFLSECCGECIPGQGSFMQRLRMLRDVAIVKGAGRTLAKKEIVLQFFPFPWSIAGFVAMALKYHWERRAKDELDDFRHQIDIVNIFVQ